MKLLLMLVSFTMVALSAPTTTTTAAAATTTTGPTSMAPPTTVGPKCPTDEDQVLLREAYAFTGTSDFQALSGDDQMLVFRLLDAVDSCRLADLIDPNLTADVFRLIDDLPIRFVHTFLDILSKVPQTD